LVEILLPAQYIRMLTITDSLVDALVDAHLDLHTRFPVCERRNDPQTIMGYVTFKDMVIAIKVNPRQPSIRGIMRQIPSLAADVPISAALEFLLKEHTHIAVVRNKENAVLGMITLEDIVEELVGDIQDEHDLLPVHVIQSGTGWIIGGGATLARIQELTQIDLGAAAKSQTFSDWAIERLRAPPRGGETFHHNTLRVAVRKVRRLHVLEAALSVEAPLAD
jgi:putative hemolysin